MTKLFLILFLLVLLMLVLSFSVINAHSVEINYYLGTMDVPLALLMVVTLSVGAIVGLGTVLKRMMGLRMEVAKLRRMVRISEQEVENLRSLPAVKDMP